MKHVSFLCNKSPDKDFVLRLKLSWNRSTCSKKKQKNIHTHTHSHTTRDEQCRRRLLCSFFLQRLDERTGVQPGHQDCVELSQAHADGADPLRPGLACRQEDHSKCKRRGKKTKKKRHRLFAFPKCVGALLLSLF